MKKLLTLSLAIPFSISACGSKPWDGLSALYHTGDGIGDTYAKSYTKEDMKIIDNLWKSTVAVNILDWWIGTPWGDDPKTPEDVRPACLHAINQTQGWKDINEPQKIIPYKDKSKDKSLLTDTTTEYTHVKGGEGQYEFILATGWLAAQNDTHYIFATNHHVGLYATKDPSDPATNPDGSEYQYKNGPGGVYNCTIMSNVNPGATSYNGITDKDIGDNGLVYNGRDPKFGSAPDLDLAMFAVKKSDMGIYDMPTIKMSNRVSQGANFEETMERLKDLLSNNTIYTAGYPKDVRRYNKGEGLAPNWWAREGAFHWNLEQPHIGWPDAEKYWQYDHADFNFWGGGGTSGSPIVNDDGELEFILTGGSHNPNRMVGGDVASGTRALGIPAYMVKEALQVQFCQNNYLGFNNLDVCQ